MSGREVLFLVHRLPYPPSKGDKIRSFHELRYLAERGWQVHLCALADDPEDMAHVPELERLCASVTVELIAPRLQRLASVRGPFLGLPLSVPYFYGPRLQRRVDDLLGARPIDAILCFSGPMAEYVFRSPRFRGSAGRGATADLLAPRPAGAEARRPRLVMDLVDVDSDKWTQYSRFHRWPLSWVYGLEGALLARYERRIAETFDAVTLVSPCEAELFRRRTGLNGKVHTLGNGVDLDYFHPALEPPAPPAAQPCGAPKGLVFCGAMDYFPNEDAVVWFAREILPAVREEVGETTLTIVGARPTEEVARLTELPGVRVTGRVDDVRPFVWEADASVAPIRVARGIQNKVLEAMAMGKAVVATPQAYEGIEAREGEEIAVAPSETLGFAAGVASVLKDREGAAALGRRARSAVERRYPWNAQLAPLGELLAARRNDSHALGGEHP